LRILRCILPGNRKQTPACSLLGCPVTGYDPTNLCLTSNCYILGSLPLMAAHLTRPEGRKLLVSYSSRTGHAGHNLLNHRHEPMLLFLIYPQRSLQQINSNHICARPMQSVRPRHTRRPLRQAVAHADQSHKKGQKSEREDDPRFQFLRDLHSTVDRLAEEGVEIIITGGWNIPALNTGTDKYRECVAELFKKDGMMLDVRHQPMRHTLDY
jgi:hypothetical protein